MSPNNSWFIQVLLPTGALPPIRPVQRVQVPVWFPSHALLAPLLPGAPFSIFPLLCLLRDVESYSVPCTLFYRTRVRSLFTLVTNSLTHWLTDWLLFSKLDWCDPGGWGCQFKTCWVADVDDVDRVDNSLFQIWNLKFKSLVFWPNLNFEICNKLLPTRSSSATVTTLTSFELASSHARVTSIKFTKQESVSQSVS